MPGVFFFLVQLYISHTVAIYLGNECVFFLLSAVCQNVMGLGVVLYVVIM